MASTYVTRPAIGADSGDKDIILQNGNAEVQVVASALTAARFRRLPKPADPGDKFYFVRKATSTGSFALNIQLPDGTLLKALSSASTWAQVMFDDVTGWQLIGSGSL